MAGFALIADIGATNARFAIVGEEGGVPRALEVVPVADFPTLEAAAESYIARLPTDAQDLRAAALAIAGPVTGDRVSMTNHPWTFSTKEVKSRFGWQRFDVINDVEAAALSLPVLGVNDKIHLGGGKVPVDDAPMTIVAPGTGLGIASLVPTGQTLWKALPSEGGHVTLAPRNTRESAVLAEFRREFSHVSAERLLSGIGLEATYQILAKLDKKSVAPLKPAQITEAARNKTDAVAEETLKIFAAMLGTVAGNQALAIGARGGLFIGGGIIPKLGELFDKKVFYKRLVDKGRMRAYLDAMPVWLIVHEQPSLLGLCATVCHSLIELDQVKQA